jgi:hypothetical protein
MMRRGKQLSLALAVLSVSVFFCPCSFPENEKPVFIVTGVTSRVDDKEWEDAGIGFGISSLITQHVYNSGEFVPLEENEEVSEAIKKQRAVLWKYSSEGEKKFPEEGSVFNVDYVFWGEVESCRTSREKIMVGVFSRYARTVRVSFILYARNQKTGRTMTSKGTGFSEKGATAVVFEAREGEIDFTSTMVGIATENAVKDAVNKIMIEYKENKGGQG